MRMSRIVLNPMSRTVAGTISDAHRIHRMVMAAFSPVTGGDARAQHRVLHRLEVDPYGGALVLYVQSASEPDWSRLPDELLAALENRPNPEVRDLVELEAIEAGRVVRFRLRANATRKIDTKSVDGRRRHGRRVPHRDPSRLLEWLARRGRASGFELAFGSDGQPQVSMIHEPMARGRRGDGRVTLEGVRFDGLLRISEPVPFRDAVIHGVGPGKAYGFGLLSFAPG